MLSKVKDPVRSLTARLLGLLTFALFPLALISLYQTQAVVDEANRLARTALLAETQRAVGNERELLQEAFGAAQGLTSGILASSGDMALCRQQMRRFIQSNPRFIFAGYIDADGIMDCASQGARVDFSESPDWAEAATNIERRLESRTSGAVTGRAVLIVSHPIVTEEGFKGYVSISIPHNLVNYLLPETGNFGEFFVSTLNAEGELLSASGGTEDATENLPAGVAPADLFARVGDVFDAENDRGEMRKFAVIPLYQGRVHAVGSWPIGNSQSGILSGPSSAPLAFPVLMWLVGIAVAWLGMHNLVIRHIRQLRDAMRRFALGERDTPHLRLSNPPAELAEAERAFNRMVVILSETEERREADLHDKTVLLREVHHRVKNNLQLIASITNMQMRKVRSSETKRVLAQLQRRVRGLATIHQSLYSTPEMATIDSAELVHSMVSQMDQIGGRSASAPRITTDLASVTLYPDQAVPLSMLVAEALNNAWKYAGAPKGGQSTLAVTLTQDADGLVHLVVRNSRGIMSQPPEESESDGLGTRLMEAFVTQLGGTSAIEETDDSYTLRVSFMPQGFEASSPDLAVAAS